MKTFRKIVAPLLVLLFMFNGESCMTAKKSSAKSKAWASSRAHSPHAKSKLRYKI